MSSFQKGQKVVCIDNQPYAQGTNRVAITLVKGQAYTIEEVHTMTSGMPPMLVFEEDPGKDWWRASRFTDALDTKPYAFHSDGPLTAPVDNYICTLCKNPKCSTSEKSCWKCGEPIMQVVGNIIVGSVKVIHP